MVGDSSLDLQYMQLAIELARRGLYSAAPNPRVGCVLVDGTEIIGQGFHVRAGEGHAEVNAIRDAEKNLKTTAAATAYVTLEPCSHTGKTPPCCDALIEAGVSRVVVAMTDPNPLVAGNGIRKLRSAGISVDVGVLEHDALALNPGFLKRMATGLPWVRAKLAMSLDGRTAMASGESQWITGSDARSDVQRLRAQSCAIISGVDTVIADNAALTVRRNELGLDRELSALAVERQPLRVILDSTLRLAPNAKILSQPGRTIVVAARENVPAQQQLTAAGAQVIYLPNDSGRVDLAQVLHFLGDAQCNEVLLEAGATLAGAMTEAKLIDSYVIYMAATFLGSQARPLLYLPLDTMAQQRRLRIENITRVGDDWRIDALSQAVGGTLATKR
jgi:diaminohydroxyphosphoribosylaminopyrimidine deaminase/5-amino-6-(5-phosphoribosylamino)uracil reductase